MEAGCEERMSKSHRRCGLRAPNLRSTHKRPDEGTDPIERTEHEWIPGKTEITVLL